MVIETADLFSNHIHKSNFGNLDNHTINKIKVFLLDSLGVALQEVQEPIFLN